MILFANNVAGTLAANIGPSDTLILLGAGQGVKFPSPTGGAYFYATLVHLSTGVVEVVQCTGRSGDSLTVVRGRDGTTATSFIAGSVIELRLCAQILREIDYRTVRGQANGLASLGSDGKIPYSELGSRVLLTDAVTGKVNAAVIPDSFATDTEVAAAVAPRLLKTGDAMSGVLRMEVGAAATQQVMHSFGWSNGIGRWKWVLEADASLALYAYDSAGNTPTEIAKFGSTVAGGSNLARVLGQNVWHTGNFSPASKVDTTNPATSGTLNHTGNLNVINGDIKVYRSGGTTGVVFLNSAGDRYVHYDGGKYTMPGALLESLDFRATSDRRLKKHIRRHTTAPGFADRITLRGWQWKKTGDAGVGVIAQEVQEYAPHLVTVGDSLSVDKAGLALEAVVDLAARVRQLEKVIHGSTNGRACAQLPRARATGR